MKDCFCKLSSQNLHYLEGGHGDILVLLPSLWVSSFSYRNIGETLARNYQVIIPDLYKGKSQFTKPTTSLVDYTNLLDEFLKKKKIKNYYLIGISGSGFTPPIL